MTSVSGSFNTVTSVSGGMTSAAAGDGFVVNTPFGKI